MLRIWAPVLSSRALFLLLLLMAFNNSSRADIVALGAPIIQPPPGPPPMTGHPVYTQNPDIRSCTSCLTNYATFIQGIPEFPLTTLPYTPTSLILETNGSPRIIGNDASPPIIVKFSSAVSQIVVFDSIDHVGFAWDAYQSDIYGSNDGTNFTLLFDPISVNEANVPGTDQNFTLNTWAGTGPTLVNNTLTPGNGFAGKIGYEAYFDFGPSNAYQFYGFRTSTLAVNTAGEIEQELSAVAEGVPCAVPEPSALILFASVLLGVVTIRRRTPNRISNLK